MVYSNDKLTTFRSDAEGPVAINHGGSNERRVVHQAGSRGTQPLIANQGQPIAEPSGREDCTAMACGCDGHGRNDLGSSARPRRHARPRTRAPRTHVDRTRRSISAPASSLALGTDAGHGGRTEARRSVSGGGAESAPALHGPAHEIFGAAVAVVVMALVVIGIALWLMVQSMYAPPAEVQISPYEPTRISRAADALRVRSPLSSFSSFPVAATLPSSSSILTARHA